MVTHCRIIKARMRSLKFLYLERVISLVFMMCVESFIYDACQAFYKSGKDDRTLTDFMEFKRINDV